MTAMTHSEALAELRACAEQLERLLADLDTAAQAAADDQDEGESAAEPG
jgi:hypothetical protein